MSHKIKDFASLVASLSNFWQSKGCAILQPYSGKVGAATFHPATFFGALSTKDYRVAYAQPCFRPSDGRYGKNPNRLQHYYQFQVLCLPSPDNIQDIYLESLEHIGIDTKKNDIRFVEDDWENPTIGSWGLGWEVWCNGMEVTQFTYFQQVGLQDCSLTPVEIAYGLERLAMYILEIDSVYNLPWSVEAGLSYGDVFLQNEVQFSDYNFNIADVDFLSKEFNELARQFDVAIDKSLHLVAYQHLVDANHVFNLLDARGAISVSARAAYISQIATMASRCAALFISNSNK